MDRGAVDMFPEVREKKSGLREEVYQRRLRLRVYVEKRYYAENWGKSWHLRKKAGWIDHRLPEPKRRGKVTEKEPAAIRAAENPLPHASVGQQGRKSRRKETQLGRNLQKEDALFRISSGRVKKEQGVGRDRRADSLRTRVWTKGGEKSLLKKKKGHQGKENTDSGPVKRAEEGRRYPLSQEMIGVKET